LLLLALEGAACILLAAPLGAGAAAAGGVIGRAAALERGGGGTPLMSVAVLPALFVSEAAMPPSAPIALHQSIEIAAPPDRVWQALTSPEPIRVRPGLVAAAGLAYPIEGRLVGGGAGALRIGIFSTGVARERVTAWQPGARLAFEVLSQPPAMEEMSPYRRVYAPHVEGYLDTFETSFELQALPGGGTRLTLRSAHVLRIDPVLYWEPIARWALGRNVSAVLSDIRDKAEKAAQAEAAGAA
jgi:hypothetical protein